jgi:hypothetical protein
MQAQTTLEKKQIPSQNGTSQKPWKGICCKQCWFAKTEPKKCKCRCHGENHQKGLKRETKKDEDSNELLQEAQVKRC